MMMMMTMIMYQNYNDDAPKCSMSNSSLANQIGNFKKVRLDI